MLNNYIQYKEVLRFFVDQIEVQSKLCYRKNHDLKKYKWQKCQLYFIIWCKQTKRCKESKQGSEKSQNIHTLDVPPAAQNCKLLVKSDMQASYGPFFLKTKFHLLNTAEHFLGLYTFSLYGHNGFAQGPQPLTKGPWIWPFW